MGKRVKDSYTETIEILLSKDMNGYNRLFGGKLMEWADVTAAVVARRHSGRNVTTACVDDLQFLAGAYINDTIVLQGRMTYVGKTSMEVRVDTFVEALNGNRTLVNTAYFVLIALDENERPCHVPSLILESPSEVAEFESGRARREHRKKIRHSKF